MTWYFCWWRRGCLGHPQALTLVLLGYVLGWHGHPQAWDFFPSFIWSYHSSLPTLENFLHTKLHTIFISNINVIKIINPLWFSFNTSLTPIKTLATVTTSFKALPPEKISKRKRLRRKCKYWQKSVKTEQQVKIDFFENIMLLKSKSGKLMKVR